MSKCNQCQKEIGFKEQHISGSDHLFCSWEHLDAWRAEKAAKSRPRELTTDESRVVRDALHDSVAVKSAIKGPTETEQ